MNGARRVMYKSDLSPARQGLVDLMRKVNFGKIEGLRIRSGDPVFDPMPRVVREIKLGGDNGCRQEGATTDFALKGQVIELFCEFDKLGDGTIETIEVKHGLPFLMRVSEGKS